MYIALPLAWEVKGYCQQYIKRTSAIIKDPTRNWNPIFKTIPNRGTSLQFFAHA
jgi:hypothetical protein